jgi:hypothetical protein
MSLVLLENANNHKGGGGVTLSAAGVSTAPMCCHAGHITRLLIEVIGDLVTEDSSPLTLSMPGLRRTPVQRRLPSISDLVINRFTFKSRRILRQCHTRPINILKKLSGLKF